MVGEEASATPAGDAQAAERAVATAEFLLRLRARGIRDLAVLRAIERVPRHIFVPHRYADLAARDVALPIGCGQTMPDPYFLAHMIEALALEKSHRVLEIGTGSGYVTAVLARLAADVLSVERFQSLGIEAKARLQGLGVDNANVVWGDGLDLPSGSGPFDRIVVEALVDDVPPAWLDALARDGAILVAQATTAGIAARRPAQHLVRVVRGPGGELARETVVASRLQPLIPGLSQGL